MTIDSFIKRVAVRIEGKITDGRNDILGSGILWRPDEESDYDYVFTAAHVVEGLNESVCVIRYLDDIGNENSIEIKNTNICKHQNFLKNENASFENDIAVIRFNKLSLNILSYYFQDSEGIPSGDILKFRGFPECINDKDSFKLSAKSDEGSFLENDKYINKFSYSISEKANINLADRNSELIGFSGMGLFLEKTRSLIGIHSYGVKNDAPFNQVLGMSANLIIEVCEYKKWDLPKFKDNIDGELNDCINFFIDEIKNQYLKNIMINEVVLKNYTNIIKSDSCGCSKECTKSIPEHKCICFRGNLLILLSILKYMESNLEDEELNIIYNSEYYPVKYICSEGVGVISRIGIGNFIESLKTDYLCKNIIKDNTLIIWSSEKSTRDSLRISNEEFKNILPDIKCSLISNNEVPFDIRKGFTLTKSLSVIHINEIIEHIRKFDENEDLEYIKEFIYQLLW